MLAGVDGNAHAPRMVPIRCLLRILCGAILFTQHASAADDGSPFIVDLRYRAETGDHTGRFHTFWKKAEWEARKTAIIVCDMWDSHHSVTAVRRVNELAPHLNEVLNAARARGATIIHAPSDCMPHYKDHAARVRALGVPQAEEKPDGIAAWSYRIDSEDKATYPIDQSDGGEDAKRVGKRAVGCGAESGGAGCGDALAGAASGAPDRSGRLHRGGGGRGLEHLEARGDRACGAGGRPHEYVCVGATVRIAPDGGGGGGYGAGARLHRPDVQPGAVAVCEPFYGAGSDRGLHRGARVSDDHERPAHRRGGISLQRRPSPAPGDIDRRRRV